MQPKRALESGSRRPAKGSASRAFIFLLCLLAVPYGHVAPAQEKPPVNAGDEEPTAATEEAGPISGLRELWNLYGVDDSHFRMLRDGVPVDEDQSEALLKCLFAVRKTRPVDMDRWTDRDTDWSDLTRDSAASQGTIVRLSGRVARVTIERPVPEVADRFEIDQYYRCQFLIGESAAPATVFALNVPKAWPINADLSARASVQGVYLKNSAADGEPPHPALVAKRIAWHPESAAQGVLGDLGFDIGLFDHVKNRGSLATASAMEREAFYQLLAAAGRAGKQELLRRTNAQLAAWRRELPSLIEEIRRSAPPGEKREEELATLGRVLTRAKENQSDVVPLFNAPQTQHGRLVALEGTARRIVLIRVDDEDVRRRFGIDHYFEIELFTDDSQGNPIVFCVRELPEGMPQGEDVSEPVRLAGFFFKTWGYRLPAQPAAEDAAEDGAKKQLAPLLIGRAPQWLRESSAGSTSLAAVMAGVCFVLALAVIWIAVWCYRRGDRRFHQRTIAHIRDANVTKSLHDLEHLDDGPPDFRGLHQDT